MYKWLNLYKRDVQLAVIQLELWVRATEDKVTSSAGGMLEKISQGQEAMFSGQWLSVAVSALASSVLLDQ